jgi:hypothetical protein
MTTYPYARTYVELFETEQGRQVLEDVVELVDKQSAEFSALHIIDALCAKRRIADSWMILNALDHLMTLGVLRELTAGQNTLGQNRRYAPSE